jgi:transcriptional antiterminator NusG
VGIQWYAIQVRPRCELSVAKILNVKGFEPFVPQYKSRRVWSDRKVELDFPLFPGYMFCQFDAIARLPILTTAGVIRVVGTSKEPLPIDASEIEAVQQIVQSGFKAEPHPFIPLGSKVRVQSGPLTGLEGVVQGYKNRQLILSIGLIQRSVAVDLGDEATTLTEPTVIPELEVICPVSHIAETSRGPNPPMNHRSSEAARTQSQ